MSEPGLRERNLRTLAALAAVFLVPLLLAFFGYYGTDWRPAGRVNHGTLISPPRPLPQVPLSRVRLAGAADDARRRPTPLRGQWSLVYVGAGSCQADCRAALVLMRQTRLALNTDMTRVARVFLVSGACCAQQFLAHQHQGLVVLDAAAPAAAPLLDSFPGGRAATVFVVDPLGNLMMSYDARQDPRGLLEDLKKLLRLSHIG